MCSRGPPASFSHRKLIEYAQYLLQLHSLRFWGLAVSKFIIATFLILGWGFYELSGGSEFEPEAWPQTAEASTAIASDTSSASVTRSETITLNLTPNVVQASLDVPVAQAEPRTAEELVLAIAASVEDVVAEVEVAVAEQASAALDLRAVAGSRVNMREGPGTNFGVIDTLTGGTEAEVIEVNAEGWAYIRLVGTNQTGWMAERLLNPI